MIERFQADDLAEICELLERTNTRMRIDVTGGDHHARLTKAALGPLHLHRLAFRMSFAARVGPLGEVAIGRSRRGLLEHRAGARATRHRPGDLFLTAQPDQEFDARSTNFTGEYARFDTGLFARVADGAPGRSARRVRFTGYRPVSARAAAAWNQAYDFVRDHVAGLPAGAEPLVVASAGQLLAAVTLATFPNTALRDPAAVDRRDARPATLRRAVAFIDENAHRPIMPLELAAVARTSIRSVQLAFRRHLNTTPTGHLRRVRLEHAHRELLDADPAATTVSAVAMRWGFASHSSFTAAYRAAFGVLPSETLRRR